MYVWGALTETDRQQSSVADASKVLRWPIRHPTFPPAGEQVTSFSVGQKHAVAVAGGTVYGMGNNACKQLGKLLPEAVENFRPIGFSSQSPVMQVVCGLKHTMIRTEDGNIYSCGDNTFKQLGHSTRTIGWNPIRIPHIKQLACGGNTCYALNARGEIYSWGSVRGGACGHGTRGEKERMKAGAEEYNDVVQPTVVEWFVNKRIKIVEISAGKDHFVCRDENDVFVCGDGSYGKLGQGDNQEYLEPVRVELPPRKHKEKLIAVAAGGDQTLILKQSSEFGSILYFTGRVGNGHDRYLTPEILTVPYATTITSIQCGVGHCYALSADGVCYGWGQFGGNLPCLGTGATSTDKKVPSPLAGLSDGKFISGIQTSNFLAVAIADDSKLQNGAVPEVILPHEERISKQPGHFSKNPYDYDEARRSCLSFLMGGEDNAERYISTLGVPAAIEEAPAFELKKRGAHGLNVGSKVRLWMTDVYALAKISARDIAGKPKNHFEVQWVRDDWDDEVVEMRSEDETINEENPDRWQRMWFLGDEDE